ncbi:hypothetical protein [Streptomyces griseochromogenes]|uniref:hypothetical protein n=1 Tax=Streptomyces griseochromogenes TaxID=68214 RepID=UPI0037B4CE20
MALIGGTRLTADDGSHGENMYGFRADDLDHAKETPWGAPAEREYEGWAWLAHQGKQVWDGVWHDGVIGTVNGLGTLFGADGGHAAGEAWKSLAKLSTASGLTGATMGAWWLVPEDKLPSWLRDARTVHKEAAKGFVAYDQWKTNPARAAGAAGFNVLTVVGTEGAGAAVRGAGEAGAATRALSVIGKVSRAADPMTYVGEAGKFAFVKVGDTFTRLKNLQSGAYLDLPEKYGLPESARRIPEDAIPDVDAHGNTVYLTADGHILNADGSLRQRVDEAAHELSANDHGELDAAARDDHSHELVGAGARAEHGADAGGQGAGQAGRSVNGGARALGSSTAGEHTSAGASGASHGSGHGSAVASETPSGAAPERGRPDDGPAQSSGAGDHHSDHTNDDGTHGERRRELTPAERKAIQDEHVRKANEDPEWFKDHYDTLGRRKPNIGLVDGVDLPQLAKGPHGRWVAKHDMPSGPSEVRFGAKPLARDTAPDGVLPTLDKRAADRQAYRNLLNTQRAFDETPSAPNHRALTTAQATYAEQLGDVPANSKISERLGEDASKLHAIPHIFQDPEVITLPKTPNGANMFDGAYRIPDDEILIVEDKAPGNDLDWRQGRADPEDPANPHIGDDGGAAGMRVKQGTLMYLRTIMAEMMKRGGRDADLAREFRDALKVGKLRYVLVQAEEPDGSLYAGVVVEEMKIY